MGSNQFAFKISLSLLKDVLLYGCMNEAPLIFSFLRLHSAHTHTCKPLRSGLNIDFKKGKGLNNIGICIFRFRC